MIESPHIWIPNFYPRVRAVVGLQWGDEGKGKIIDLLAQDADVVIRGTGGNNAGHSVVIGEEIYALSLVPSGIFNPNTLNILGSGVVIDPNAFIKETQNLEERGISTKNLIISKRAHLVLDAYKYIDALEEGKRGDKKIGTTGKGIGPAYMLKAMRSGLRTGDIYSNKDEFLKKVDGTLEVLRRLYYPGDTVVPHVLQAQYYEQFYDNWKRNIVGRLRHTEAVVNSHLSKGSNILLEGAQGVLLDVDHGTYPYVTSSNSGVAGLVNGSDIPVVAVTDIIGVGKAYLTRVGEGPFPTKREDEWAKKVRERGHEYGTVTGRPRDIGDFDGIAVGYADRLSGFTEVIITKLDILSGVGDLRICRRYQIGGGVTESFITYDLGKCSPRYRPEDIYKGWDYDLSQVDKISDLPKEPYLYLQGLADCFIESSRDTGPLGKISAVGNGRERDQIIVVK